MRRTAIALLIVYAIWATVHGGRALNPEPSLRVDPDLLDLGEQWVSGSFRRDIKVVNASDRRADVLDLRPACACTRLEPSQFSLEPGESQLVHVYLNLFMATASGDSRPGVRRFSTSVYPELPVAQGGGAVWTFHGTVKIPLEVPRFISFGTVDVDTRRLPSRSLSVKPLVAVKEVKAHCVGAAVRVRPADPNSPGKTGWTIDVELSKSTVPGWFEFPLGVAAILPDGSETPEQSVLVNGTAVADIDWSPKEITSAARRVGETVTEDFEIWSGSGRKFSVKPDSRDREHSPTVKVVDQGGGRRYLVQAEYRVTDPGDKSVRVSVLASDARGRKIQITVPLAVHGIPAANGN